MCKIFCVCLYMLELRSKFRSRVTIRSYSIFINFSLKFFTIIVICYYFFYQHLTCVWIQTSMENLLWMIDKYASNFLCKYILYIKKKNRCFANRKSSTKTWGPYFTFKIILTKKISCQELRLWNAIFTKFHLLYIFV